MPPFDLQSIWTGAGLSAAAVIIGYVLGFLASAMPAITATEALRRYDTIALDVVLVGAAALTSGATPNPGNVVGAVLVFIGIYNAASHANAVGIKTAVAVANGSPEAKG